MARCVRRRGNFRGEMTFPEGVKPILNDDVVVAIVAKTRTAISEDAEDGEEATGPVVTSEAAAE